MHQNREWIRKAIIDFRKENNVEPKIRWCELIAGGCLEHSKYMAKIGNLEHTPLIYLLDKGECVGFTSSYSWSIEDKIRQIIFNFGEDAAHRDDLLNHWVYGGDIALSDDPQLMHELYLTLRFRL